MCGSLFFALLSNFAVWAIHCRHSPKILKDGQKTEDFSLHFVRLSTMYLLDSPFTKMISEMMN